MANTDAAPVAAIATPDNANTKEFVVATDIDAIQTYLFQSVHLDTIVGASGIISAADDLLATDARCKRSDADCGEAVVHSGGIGLVRFKHDECARTFSAAIERSFRESSVSGHMTVFGPVTCQGPKGFGGTVLSLLEQVECKKRLGYAHDESLSIPHAEKCQSCGSEPATHWIPKGSGRRVGPACHAKFASRNQEAWRHWPLVDAAQAPLWKAICSCNSARDFNELAGEYDLGLIVADADGTGQRLGLLKDSAKESWSAFSEGLSRLSQSALQSAMLSTAPDVGQPPRFKGDVLPILPLFCGGDDFVIACRGDLALPLASRLCASFQTGDQTWIPPDGRRLGLSAGVVITRPGFPFRVAHRIAERLLRNAKREAKAQCWSQQGKGAIDYALITESMADPESLLEDRVIELRDNTGNVARRIRLTGRPYKADTVGERSIGTLESVVAHLHGASFPRSKLHELRSLCSAATWVAGHQLGESDFDQIRKGLCDSFLDWEARTLRREETAEVWKKTIDTMQLKNGSPMVWFPWGQSHCQNQREGQTSDSEWITPVGDLADASRIFGQWTDREGADDEVHD